MVRPLPIHAHAISLVPQPPLPQVPGLGTGKVAGAAPRRVVAHRVLPRGLHAPRAHCGHRLLQQKVVYDILFRATAQTLLTIARDPKRLGVELGFFAVLHSWGQNLHFHPHLHCVVPGGGLSADQDRWIHGRRRYLLPVKVLSRLFRRLFLEAMQEAYAAGQLQFFGELEPLRDPPAFAAYLAPLHQCEWVVYAKPPFGGPQHVLEYLGRYTHRVALSNRRLLALQQGQVSFAWKDYRDKQQPQKVMTVSAEEFIRRFLQHALPPGFQRIRYYGFLANCHRAEKLALCRQLLAPSCSELLPQPAACRNFQAALVASRTRLCPKCGIGILISIQILWPCHGPVPLRLDSS